MGKSFVIKQFVINFIKEEKDKKNFCIVVPTRALIKQYVLDLNKELIKFNLTSHNVLTNANVLEFVDVEDSNYIFILTPERLNILLFSRYEVDIHYLIVDEAHKVFDEDTRGITYYSSIDMCMSKHKDMRVFFASPLIQNPEIFSESYERSYISKYQTNESPVTQNLFYIDLHEKTVELIDSICLDIDIKIKDYEDDNNNLYYNIGEKNSNIIYVSGKDRAIKYAMEFVEYLQENEIELLNFKDNEEIEKICSVIEDNIHKDYYLIKALRKGVAYHFGKLPTIVRENVENLFKCGVIKYLFCTNTLLEGVNLPAKNIFIMANYIGNKKMKSLDFWNLAGRLGYEYYGNVFCVNDFKRQYAWKDKSVLENKYNIRIEDKLNKNMIQNKKKIKEILMSDELTRDLKKVEQYNNYLANVIQIDSITNQDSAIVKKAMNVDSDLVKICQKRDSTIDYDVVNSAKSIDYKIQNKLYKKTDLFLMGTTINYDTCFQMLEFMYDNYRWDIKEERLNNKNKLKYIALLMNSWINGIPLNAIIDSSIEYNNNNKRNIMITYGEYKRFKKEDIEHINILINEIIKNIEDVLRFDLEKYFNHYYNMIKTKYDESIAGPNWALYLEFGTRRTKDIILQNAGFSRYVSNILIQKYLKYLMFEGNRFKGIKKKILSTDIINNSVVLNEVSNSTYLQ